MLVCCCPLLLLLFAVDTPSHLHNTAPQLNLASRSLQQYHPSELPPLLAHCSQLPPNCWPNRRWSVTVMTRLQPHLSTLSPRSLALAAWGLGRMGLRLRQDFATLLLSGFKGGLQLTRPRDLALMVHGLACCKCRPDGQWVGVYLARVEQQLSGFSAADLAMMLGGLVKLR